MNTLKLGIIGLGYIGFVHLENILKFPDVKITLVDSQSNKRDKIPKGISYYADYKTMLSKERLDAVLICTPTYLHTDIACFFAENGINIFLEKPMAPTLEDCDLIIDTVKENKVKLFVGHVLRYWPTYASVKNHLFNNDSKLGEILSIEGKRLQTFPWSNWFADQNKSGGVILDLSIHDIDYALWIFGDVNSVSCKAKIIKKHNMQVFGEANSFLKFKNNKTAEIEGSWAKPADFQFYAYTKIEGSEQTIEFDGQQIYNNDFWNIHNIFSSEDGYFNQLEHFINIILEKKSNNYVSGLEGKKAVKTCLAAIKSAKDNGKEIFLEDLE